MTAATLLVLAAPSALATHRDLDVDIGARADLEIEARAKGNARMDYAWDWGDGEASAGAKARHAYRAPGVYRVVVTATDEAGHEWRREREVEVRAPPASARVEQAGATATARADVDARTRVTWDWGDGEVSHGRRVRHTYDEAGSYELTVVYERAGSRWVETRALRVEVDRDDEGAEARGGEGVLSVRARVDLGAPGRAQAHLDDPRGARGGSEAHVETSSSHADRHDVPGVGVPLALGASALGGALLRRKR